MAQRAQFENSNEVGVFAKLTNSYCICALGGSQKFYSVFEAELADHIPVVQTSIGGTRIIGIECADDHLATSAQPCDRRARATVLPADHRGSGEGKESAEADCQRHAIQRT